MKGELSRDAVHLGGCNMMELLNSGTGIYYDIICKMCFTLRCYECYNDLM